MVARRPHKPERAGSIPAPATRTMKTPDAEHSPNTKSLESTRAAYAKGYRVSDVGDVVSPTGRRVRSARSSRPHSRSYFCIRLSGVERNKSRVSVFVHKLAAYQQFGDAAFGVGIHVRHLDGDSSNNRPDNLALGSPSDNFMDQPREIRVARARHAASARRLLSQDQADSLRSDRALGAKYADLMTKYGVGKSTVAQIISGEIYSPIPSSSSSSRSS